MSEDTHLARIEAHFAINTTTKPVTRLDATYIDSRAVVDAIVELRSIIRMSAAGIREVTALETIAIAVLAGTAGIRPGVHE